jgi:NAD+ synthase (glutamine-hydrolysing)
VFGGHCLAAENGVVLGESDRFRLDGVTLLVDIDVDRLSLERAQNITFATSPQPSDVDAVGAAESLPVLAELRRSFARTPFVPSGTAGLDARAEEIFAIQSTGLARRMLAARADRAVLGLSGGLDSTLALLVTLETMVRLGREATSIECLSMPGLGTTEHTRSSASELAAHAGVTFREIAIGPAVAQHFADIGHDPGTYDVVFENSQARERTQILFDVANQVRGIVVGTGDLSELALGWCTFNADQMANYAVNTSVPKTLVRHLVDWYARNRASEEMAAVLRRILGTVISPELLPTGASGEIVQATEDIVGPYELHDFFLYHRVRNGFAPRKVQALAHHAFCGDAQGAAEDSTRAYDRATVDRWLRVFLERFARQQFKRTTLPPGPKVGSVSLSPRGDLRLPDELDAAVFTAQLD